MTFLTKRPRPGGPDLARHTIGNATVVYRVGHLSDQARVLALTVAEDRENALVVVDLPAESPVSVWDSVAEVLPRRRGGVRVVIGGRSRETTALAGQLLSERLGRSVIAPDGTVIRGAGGSLIVHSGHGSGWVRYRRGRAPRWEAKRFPKPPWDADVPTDIWPTSALGVAEPIPGGVWIRAVGYDARQRWHRVRLTEGVPIQNDVLTVVLGCPGNPPLRLDDVARMFSRIPEASRGKVRFVHYGPMSVPAGGTLGQALADLVGTEITCYTGLPMDSAFVPDVHTIRPDGSLGWRAFARELTYRPHRAQGPVPPPTLRSHRKPFEGLIELAPRVYWHAPDAVIEVTQSGLLVRATRENENTPALRAATLDTGFPTLVFDATGENTPDRMRFLAEDLLRRLDQATQSATRVLPAAAFLAERYGANHQDAVASSDLSAHEKGMAFLEDLQSERTEVMVWPQPQTVQQAHNGQAVGDVAAPHESEPVLVTGSTASVEQAVPDNSVAATSVAEPAQSPERDPVARLKPVPPPSAPVVLAGMSVSEPPSLAPTPVQVAEPAAGPAGPPAPRTSGQFRLDSEHTGSGDTAPESETEAVEDSAAAPEPFEHQDEPAEVRVAPTPSPEACALLPDRGLEEERTWLRHNLAGQFGTMSNSVARVLSQNPGFQGALSRSSTEVLTDAVAVQLYLSPQGKAIDDGLRSAVVGPHLPIARCVVSGLSRLPSHRGPSVFAAKVTESQREFYRERQLVTEWGFLNALTAPCANQTGDTDIAIWSMTARRTKLLEPQQAEVTDRVLFMPGTSFKVLEMSDKDSAGNGGRARILMRELGAAEIDDTGHVDQNRASLDELALNTLRRQLERWAEATPWRRVGSASAARFDTLPGLA